MDHGQVRGPAGIDPAPGTLLADQMLRRTVGEQQKLRKLRLPEPVQPQVAGHIAVHGQIGGVGDQTGHGTRHHPQAFLLPGPVQDDAVAQMQTKAASVLRRSGGEDGAGQ